MNCAFPYRNQWHSFLVHDLGTRDAASVYADVMYARSTTTMWCTCGICPEISAQPGVLVVERRPQYIRRSTYHSRIPVSNGDNLIAIHSMYSKDPPTTEQRPGPSSPSHLLLPPAARPSRRSPTPRAGKRPCPCTPPTRPRCGSRAARAAGKSPGRGPAAISHRSRPLCMRARFSGDHNEGGTQTDLRGHPLRSRRHQRHTRRAVLSVLAVQSGRPRASPSRAFSRGLPGGRRGQ